MHICLPEMMELIRRLYVEKVFAAETTQPQPCDDLHHRRLATRSAATSPCRQGNQLVQKAYRAYMENLIRADRVLFAVRSLAGTI